MKKKPRVYFDWSAAQNLIEKKDKKLLGRISKKFFVMFSTVNIYEASVIPKREQRLYLLKSYRKLNPKSDSVLDLPDNLLKTSYLALKKGENGCSAVLRGYDIIDFLEYPENYPDDYIEDLKEQNLKIDNFFIEMNREIRSDPKVIVAIENDPNEPALSNEIVFLKHQLENDKFLKSIFSSIMKAFKIKNFKPFEGPNIINKMCFWKCYWCALLLGNFRLGIKTENYSPKKNPLLNDLKQTIYCCTCEYFVTDDNPFFELLKSFIESDIVDLNVRILKLDDFIKLL
jgi:hypothetical protein